MENFYFRKLDVYQNSKKLVTDVCQLISTFPKYEQYNLVDQLRRAVMSIPINIAEGFGRFSSKEKAHFLEIAYGSLTEVLCEMELSLDQKYITIEQYDDIEKQLIVIAKQLSKLHSSVLTPISNK